MKILIACTPATGHLNPMLAISRVLIAEGHELAFLSGSVLRDRIEAVGATFHALPKGADFDLRSFDEVAPELKTMPPGLDWLRVALQRVFVDTLPFQHDGLRQVLRGFPADVIVADDMLFGVLPMLLGPRSKRPPIALCGTSLLHWPREDGAPHFVGLPPAATQQQRDEYAEIYRVHDEAIYQPVGARLNETLRKFGRCLHATDGSELRVSARDSVHGAFHRHTADHSKPGAAAALGGRARRLAQGGAGDAGNAGQP
jgi:hypothetical protein